MARRFAAENDALPQAGKGGVGAEAGPPGWSEAERWAWGEIRAGRIADFSARYGALDPDRKAGWGESRSLGTAFLREILFSAGFADLVPVEGVRVVGALFAQPLVLGYGRWRWPLWLDRCRFEAAVDLVGLEVDGWLSLEGSSFHGSPLSLSLVAAKAAHANISGTSFRGKVDLANCQIAGQLHLVQARLRRHLELGGVRANQLFLREASCQGVGLRAAVIQDVFDLGGAVVGGRLLAEGMRIGGDLVASSASRGAHFKGRVNFGASQIAGSVYFDGATFDGDLLLYDLRVARHLLMRSAPSRPTVFNGNVDISYGGVSGHLNMNGSVVKGDLGLMGLQVGENLYLSMRVGKGLNGATATVTGHVDMSGARLDGLVDFHDADIGKSLYLTGAVFDEKMLMPNLQVRQKLDLRATFRNGLSLAGAEIGDRLFADGAELRGAVEMNRMKVGGDFVFRTTDGKHQLVDGSMDLSLAGIGGVLMMSFIADGMINMTAIHVGQHVFLTDGVFNFPVHMAQAHLDQMLDLSGSTFAGLDLGGAVIGGLLRLGFAEPSKVTWAEGTRLDLRDATAGALQDWAEPAGGDRWRSSWPTRGRVELDGFSYGRLGGVGVQGVQQMLDRDVSWYADWLSRDEPYSAQPYEHLAATFRRAGEPGKADEILYRSRERARVTARLAGQKWRSRGLALLKWTIGYGIGLRFFRALIWVSLLTALGVLVLLLDGSGGEPREWPELLAYSLDELLPIVELRGGADPLPLASFAERYFYVHRLLGFFLGGFIAAGVAGLTQYSKS